MRQSTVWNYFLVFVTIISLQQQQHAAVAVSASSTAGSRVEDLTTGGVDSSTVDTNVQGNRNRWLSFSGKPMMTKPSFKQQQQQQQQQTSGIINVPAAIRSLPLSSRAAIGVSFSYFVYQQFLTKWRRPRLLSMQVLAEILSVDASKTGFQIPKLIMNSQHILNENPNLYGEKDLLWGGTLSLLDNNQDRMLDLSNNAPQMNHTDPYSLDGGRWYSLASLDINLRLSAGSETIMALVYGPRRLRNKANAAIAESFPTWMSKMTKLKEDPKGGYSLLWGSTISIAESAAAKIPGEGWYSPSSSLPGILVRIVPKADDGDEDRRTVLIFGPQLDPRTPNPIKLLRTLPEQIRQPGSFVEDLLEKIAWQQFLAKTVHEGRLQQPPLGVAPGRYRFVYREALYPDEFWPKRLRQGGFSIRSIPDKDSTLVLGRDGTCHVEYRSRLMFGLVPIMTTHRVKGTWDEKTGEITWDRDSLHIFGKASRGKRNTEVSGSIPWAIQKYPLSSSHDDKGSGGGEVDDIDTELLFLSRPGNGWLVWEKLNEDDH